MSPGSALVLCPCSSVLGRLPLVIYGWHSQLEESRVNNSHCSKAGPPHRNVRVAPNKNSHRESTVTSPWYMDGTLTARLYACGMSAHPYVYLRLDNRSEPQPLLIVASNQLRIVVPRMHLGYDAAPRKGDFRYCLR